jgi:hypothetical protein
VIAHADDNSGVILAKLRSQKQYEIGIVQKRDDRMRAPMLDVPVQREYGRTFSKHHANQYLGAAISNAEQRKRGRKQILGKSVALKEAIELMLGMSRSKIDNFDPSDPGGKLFQQPSLAVLD